MGTNASETPEIDDDKGFYTSIHGGCLPPGFAVSGSWSAREGLEKNTDNPPDLIII